MKNLIILAGGKSSRFQESFPNTHKMLLPWKNQLWIDEFLHVIVNAHKFKKIYFSLGCYSDQVISYLDSSTYKNLIEYFIESVPLGTGGGTMTTMKLFNLENSYVMNCDSLYYGNLEQIDKFKFTKNMNICMGLVNVSDRSRFGNVEYENGFITSFKEKNNKGFGLINSGIYKVNYELFNNFKVNTNFSLEHDIFEKIVVNNEIYAVVLDGQYVDIGVPDEYFKKHKIYDF